MTSPGNRRCANCIGTLSLPMARSPPGGAAMCRAFPVLRMTSRLHSAVTTGGADKSVVYSKRLRGFDTEVNTETDPPGGSTGPGAKSDIYD